MLGWEKLWSVFKLICTLSVKWFCIIATSQDITPSYRLEELFLFPTDSMLFFCSQILLLFFSPNLLAVKSVKQLVCNGDRPKPQRRTERIAHPHSRGRQALVLSLVGLTLPVLEVAI